MASQKNGTLYIGVTTDLVRRVFQHRNGSIKGFSSKHGVCALVYYEEFREIRFALQREKNLKGWNRLWKLRIVEETNPKWRDLYAEITGECGD